VVSVAGIGINLLVLYILHERAGMAAWLANLIGIFTATAWNYIINNLWTWRQRSEVSPRSMNDYGRP
jgi:dolichol-phosphate mannosyltransferase